MGSWEKWRHLYAPVAGIAFGLLFLGFSLILRLGTTTAATVDTEQYGLLAGRYDALGTRLMWWPKDIRQQRLVAYKHWCVGSRALGLPFDNDCGDITSGSPSSLVYGYGYVDLWRRLHAAEQEFLVAMVNDTPPPVAGQPVIDQDLIDQEFINVGLTDELRLIGSDIPSAQPLLERLRTALTALGAATLLRTQAPAATVTAATDVNPGARRKRARAAIITVNKSVDEYRDDRRSGLVRSRNRLLSVGIVAGLFAYALLTLAIVVRADPRAIVAATVFFGVGVVVGLIYLPFDRERELGFTEDDFGLDRATILFRPILSGLASVAGTVLIALLFSVVANSGLVYDLDEPEATTTSSIATTGGDSTSSGESGTTGEATEPESAELATPCALSSAQAVGVCTDEGGVLVVVVNPTADETLPSNANDADASRDSLATVRRIDPPTLGEIFDLGGNPIGILYAAIFGLTPKFLFDRLQSTANRLRSDLKASSSTG